MLFVFEFCWGFFVLFCLFFFVVFLKMNNNRLDRFEGDLVLLAFAVTFALGLLPRSQPTFMNSRYHMNYLYVLSLLLVHALHGRSDY